MNHRCEKKAPSLLQVNLSPSLTIYSCITVENQLTVTFVKEQKIDTRGQTVLKKQQIVCSSAEIGAFKKYLSLLEYFKLYHVYARERAKKETNPYTYAQAASSSSNVPDRWESSKFSKLSEREMWTRLLTTRKFVVWKPVTHWPTKKADANSKYTTYEFVIVY